MPASMLIGPSLTLATSPAVARSRAPHDATSVIDSQDEDQPLPQQQRQTPLGTNLSGRTARSSVGQVGQR